MAFGTNVYSTLNLGRTAIAFKGQPLSDGIYEEFFINEGETILASLEVYSVTPGTQIKLQIFTHGDDDSTPVSIAEYPVITAATGTILLRKAAVSMSRIIVRATITGGTAVFKVWMRALSIGETSVRIVGASSFTVTRQLVASSPQVITGGDLDDRYSLCLKNTGPGMLYIAETSVKANPTDGYPISIGESLGFDLQAGTSLWGYSVSTSDVALAEGGGGGT